VGKQADKFAGTVASATGGLTGTVDGKAVAFDPVTIVTLITTLLPMITDMIQKCRDRRQQRQQEQQDTPQQQIAAAHANPKQREQNVTQLQTRILRACEKGKREELKRAKATGLPADLGRYAIDADGAYRLAGQMQAQFVVMKPADAAALCAECGVT
jgi:hypothetical protein